MKLGESGMELRMDKDGERRLMEVTTDNPYIVLFLQQGSLVSFEMEFLKVHDGFHFDRYRPATPPNSKRK